MSKICIKCKKSLTPTKSTLVMISDTWECCIKQAKNTSDGNVIKPKMDF